MIIYLAFLQSKCNHPIPAYQFWEYYIKNGIEEAGYEWIESNVDWAEALTYSFDKKKLNEWKSRTWGKVLLDLKKTKMKPHVFLSYFYPQHIDIQAIKEIQKLGVVCVNFFCDHVREYTSIPEEFGAFDLNWVPEYKALNMYKKARYPYLHLPMPMWVEPTNRYVAESENTDVSFIGSKDLQRQLLFEQVLQKEAEVKIYGSAWLPTYESIATDPPYENIMETGIYNKIKNQAVFINRYGITGFMRKIEQRNFHPAYSTQLQKAVMGKPDFKTYIKISKESMVTLGVNRYPSFRFPLGEPDTYSRLRDIEAPMLGACYLTEWTEGLDQMYEIGSEIETYRNADEMTEKIKQLQSDKPKRKHLRMNGQKKALDKHGIPHSLLALQKYFNI